MKKKLFLTLAGGFILALAFNNQSVQAQEYLGSPVYRFWSSKFKSHFYTIKDKEKDKLINTDPNWKYEGIAYSAISVDKCAEEDVRVFRFWSPAFKSHFYTNSLTEKSKLDKTDFNWKYEGIAFCTPSNYISDPTIKPVYRFWSNKFKSHFMTRSEKEKNKLIESDPNWNYEGIAFFSFAEQADAVEPTPEGDYCISKDKFVINDWGNSIYTLNKNGVKSSVKFNPLISGATAYRKNNIIAYRRNIQVNGKTNNQLFICDLNTGKVTNHGVIPSVINHFDLSEDGSKLYYYLGNKIYVYIIASDKWVTVNIPAQLMDPVISWNSTSNFIFIEKDLFWGGNFAGTQVIKISNDGTSNSALMPYDKSYLRGVSGDYLYIVEPNTNDKSLLAYNPFTNIKKVVSSDSKIFSATDKEDELASIKNGELKIYSLVNDNITVKEIISSGDPELKSTVYVLTEHLYKNLWRAVTRGSYSRTPEVVIDFSKDINAVQTWEEYIASLGGNEGAQYNRFDRKATGFNGFIMNGYLTAEATGYKTPARLITFDENWLNPQIILVK